LPISARREEIERAIVAGQVVIVAGETGSGKTTQIPKMLLELGYGGIGQGEKPGGRDRRPRMIAHTQPRRIAARATAQRIAEELGVELGQAVGYQVRFRDHSSAATRLKVMTDGVLLAQIQRDPQLRAYDAIIIDEAHERSLNIDFLLGYLSNLLPRRPDLKLIITSATIDSALFAAHFGRDPEHPAPVIEVSGRTYPVEIRYRPLGGAGAPEDQPTAIAAAARELMRAGDGDILVFCSGEREIRDAADVLEADLNGIGGGGGGGRGGGRGTGGGRVEILPLYSRLSAAEQHRVFEPHAARRIVLATNVAETSLTVPGIHYVIDPGTARVSRYSKATKVQRLPIEPISQASANQRAGRCGRIAKGVCVRLYSREDFEARPPFTDPEILRTSLASVILQMLAVGVVATPAEVARFPFVQPPDTRAVTDGVRVLEELGAIEDAGGRARLTDVGRELAAIPLDPRLARMIVEGRRLGVEREVIVVAAALSIQDPRERPLEFQAQADQLHARFVDPSSDFLALLNLWEYLRAARHAGSASAFRRLVRREYLAYLRIREWQDLVAELRRAVKGAGRGSGGQSKSQRPMPPGRLAGAGAAPSGEAEAPPVAASDKAAGRWRLDWPGELIHRALLQGLLSQIGLQQVTPTRAKDAARRGGPKRAPAEKSTLYLGARGIRFAIHPGSALRRKPPAWLMAAELVETSRLWGRVCAAIKPEWVEQAAPQLARRSYAEPRWSAKRGAAVINEKVTVYGLPVVAARSVLLARVDPALARELFIRHALVEGDWRSHHRFDQDNRALLEQAEEFAARSRRAGPALSDEDLFSFYDRRLPESVTSGAHFDAWWKRARQSEPDLLTFSTDHLAAEAAAASRDFPDHWTQDGFALPLTYEYSLGQEHGGVTVHIPIERAGQMSRDGFDWQVPGLRRDLVAALIKTLPKPLRAELLPAQETARRALERIGEPQDQVTAAGRIRPLTEALTSAFDDLRGVHVPPGAWRPESLPDYLRITFRVEDSKGREVASGRNLGQVLAQATAALNAAIERVAAASATARARARPAAVGAPATAGAAAAGAAAARGANAQAGPAGGRSALTGAGGRRGAAGHGHGAVGGANAQAGAASGQGPGGDVGGVPLGGQTGLAIALREQLLGELALAPGRLTSRLRPEQALPLAASHYPSVAALTLDAQRAVIAAALDQAGVLGSAASGRDAANGAALASAGVTDQAAFEKLRSQLRDGLEGRAHEALRTASDLITMAGRIDQDAEEITEAALADSVRDIRAHLARLLADGFLSRAGLGRLKDLRRYLAAEACRLARLGANRAREAQALAELAQVERAAAAAPGVPAELPWMIEEFRVSLFAQQLGTAYPISAKRIARALAQA
jgi:ATP-dependent helicase HrpA